MAVKFFSFLAVVFISLLLIGLILPGTWAVERSLEMPAVPEQVFTYVNDVSLGTRGPTGPMPPRSASVLPAASERGAAGTIRSSATASSPSWRASPGSGFATGWRSRAGR